MPIGAPKAPEPKSPAKAATARTAGAAARTGGMTRTQLREEGLNGIAQIGTAILMVSKNYADAGAVDMHAPAISHEVAVIAAENEKVGTIVDRLIAVGPYAALFSAAMPLVLQIMINHDRIQPGAASLMGGKVVPKSELESKVRGDIEKAKAQFLAEGQAA